HWDGCPPGEDEPFPIALPREDELSTGEVYVPAGWLRSGGDPLAPDSLPAQRVWIDGFVIGRFPVTTEEYLAFLDDLVAAGREEEALAACPRMQLGFGSEERLSFERDAAGRFVVPEADRGRLWAPDWPVFQIDWLAALAYAAWLSARTR